MTNLTLKPTDFKDPQVLNLLELHLREMHESSPPGTVFALNRAELEQPAVSSWSAWQQTQLAGIAALHDLGNGHGEIKSMRTDPQHLGRGVAAQLLRHLVALARTRGMRQLSLETGTAPIFESAIRLYQRHGFQRGERYADYPDNQFSQFFHLPLD